MFFDNHGNFSRLTHKTTFRVVLCFFYCTFCWCTLKTPTVLSCCFDILWGCPKLDFWRLLQGPGLLPQMPPCPRRGNSMQFRRSRWLPPPGTWDIIYPKPTSRPSIANSAHRIFGLLQANLLEGGNCGHHLKADQPMTKRVLRNPLSSLVTIQIGSLKHPRSTGQQRITGGKNT